MIIKKARQRIGCQITLFYIFTRIQTVHRVSFFGIIIINYILKITSSIKGSHPNQSFCFIFHLCCSVLTIWPSRQGDFVQTAGKNIRAYYFYWQIRKKTNTKAVFNHLKTLQLYTSGMNARRAGMMCVFLISETAPWSHSPL